MEATVLAIQHLYPQVFHACHVAHTRARSNAFRLSERDSAVLAHVLPDWPVTARDLARHLDIGAPAMSAALQRLERLGYLARGPRSRTSPARPGRRGAGAAAAGQGRAGDRPEGAIFMKWIWIASTIDSYLRALAAKFGEAAVPGD